jgi:hypothetical protein
MRARLLPTITGMSLALLASSAWANETHVYGIANFGGTGQCGSSDMTHSEHTDTASVFAEVFEDLRSAGKWTQVLYRNNSSARGNYFTDSSKGASCNCSTGDAIEDWGADTAKVMFMHTHGSHAAGAGGYYTSLSMGNSSYDCSVRTDQNMLWNSELEIAVVKACQSGDYDVWANGGYRPQFTTSASKLSVWNAFHGNSTCGWTTSWWVGDYAEDSIYDGVGENWIDEAYDDNWFTGDDCPTSIVMGSSSSVRDNMYEYGGWLDRKDTGPKYGSSIYYISGCDPDAGRVLP